MPVLIDNNDITDPAVNLALEEYCLTALAPDLAVVLLTVNDPTVVVGKHQCVFAEADLTRADRMGIRIIRRISGGGAVYHDGGNLNFSFIDAFDRSRFGDYAAFLRPVVDTLHGLGVPVSFGGKSDLLINGSKVSGNAQYANTHRMLCHGTLLFDARIDRLQSVLTPSAVLMAVRGVPSVRSAVTRIRDHLPVDMDMPAFIRAIRDGIKQRIPVTAHRSLEPADWDRIYRLAEDKYRRWEWNIGRSPWCRMRCRMPGLRGAFQPVVVDVDRGLITRVETADGSRGGEAWEGRRFEDLLTVGNAAPKGAV